MLRAALHQYAKERLSVKQRQARLEAEHNYVIKYVCFNVYGVSLRANHE